MGIRKITSKSKEIENFCLENMPLILQRKSGWIYPDSSIPLEKTLYASFLVHSGFKTTAVFKKKVSKANRRKMILNFNSCIRSWLDRQKKNPLNKIKKSPKKATAPKTTLPETVTSIDPLLVTQSDYQAIFDETVIKKEEENKTSRATTFLITSLGHDQEPEDVKVAVNFNISEDSIIHFDDGFKPDLQNSSSELMICGECSSLKARITSLEKENKKLKKIIKKLKE